MSNTKALLSNRPTSRPAQLVPPEEVVAIAQPDRFVSYFDPVSTQTI